MTIRSRILVFASIIQISTIPRFSIGVDEGGIHVLDEWVLTVNQTWKDRTIRRPTSGMEFEEVLLLPETKKLISETPNLEKFLLTRILERCRSGKAAGSGPEVYYSFLFCKLKGINISSLLQIAASHEQDLDYVIAAVFSDGSTDKSEWNSSWNNGTSRKKQEKLREGDPFRDG